MRVAGTFVVLLCAVACGPDEAREVARFEEVCGESGPVRLLELDDDERLLSGSRKIGDRFYFVVGPADGTTTRVVATGLCGEAPVEIARDVFSVFDDEHWPGSVLGCTEASGGDKVVLDPQGIEPTRVVSLPPACLGTPTDFGVVGVVDRDDGTLALALAPYPSDVEAPPLAPVVLAGSIRSPGFFPAYLVRGAAAYTASPTHDLLRIDLATATSAIEQPGVAHWGVTIDERYVVWRDVTDPDVEDPEAPGTVVLRDRIDGRQASFADVTLQGVPPVLVSGTRLVVDAEPELTRIIDLESFAALDVPGQRHFLREISDGRLLMAVDGLGPFVLLDPVTGVQTKLSDLRGDLLKLDTNSFDLFVTGTLGGVDDESEMWRVPYDGSGDIELAERVIPLSQFQLEGRIVTPLDVDDERLGDLVTVDPESLHEEIVDERVVANLGPHGKTHGLHPRELVYGVVDGERSGVWIARLAP